MNFLKGTLAEESGRLIFCAHAHTPNDAGIRIDLESSRFRLGASRAGDSVILGIRSEDLEILTSANIGTGNNGLEAKIDVCEPLGHETLLHLSAGSHSVIADPRRPKPFPSDRPFNCGAGWNAPASSIRRLRKRSPERMERGFFQASIVAQTGSLLYRRLEIGRAPASSDGLDLAVALQDTILRYGRLPLCATLNRLGTWPQPGTLGWQRVSCFAAVPIGEAPMGTRAQGTCAPQRLCKCGGERKYYGATTGFRVTTQTINSE